MAKKDKDLMGSDQSEMHDELGQNLEENESAAESLEEVVGDDEVQSAEEAAMNIDNETAEQATNKSEETAEEEVLEKELAAVESEKKHKNRESTSEKAKKAAAHRVEKGLEALPTKHLDPLRLRSKKYREVVKLVDGSKSYPIEEAVELIKKTSTTKFDGAVELHAKVKGESVRGTITLPHGTGKTKKVAVADEETLEKIAAGKFDFDVLIATPAQMPKLAKFAKVLGPKGLMPSPKAGTVTDDIEKVSKEIGGGRMEYRADKNSVIHMSIGRVSFKADQLVENFKAMEPILLGAKVSSISLASTVGPGVKVQISKS